MIHSLEPVYIIIEACKLVEIGCNCFPFTAYIGNKESKSKQLLLATFFLCDKIVNLMWGKDDQLLGKLEKEESKM